MQRIDDRQCHEKTKRKITAEKGKWNKSATWSSLSAAPQRNTTGAPSTEGPILYKNVDPKLVSQLHVKSCTISTNIWLPDGASPPNFNVENQIQQWNNSIRARHNWFSNYSPRPLSSKVDWQRPIIGNQQLFLSAALHCMGWQGKRVLLNTYFFFGIAALAPRLWQSPKPL